MKWVETFTEERVRVLRLNRGMTNPLNEELVEELRQHLREALDTEEVSALVITSANDKFFSLGFDLPELFHKDLQEFKTFFTSFNHLCLELYTFPKPTVAALTGHAIAGGFILASCCDYRFLGLGKKFCALNEINLGVPVPFLSDIILRQLVGDRKAMEMIYTGKMIPAEDSLQMGIVDALFSQEKLFPESIAKARELGNLPAKAFGAIKDNRTREVADKIRNRLEEDINLFLNFWYNNEARARLKEAIKKF